MADKKQNKDDVKEIGITAKKSEDFSEWYTQVIIKAEMIEYGPVSGCMIIRPYGYAIWEKIQAYFDKAIKEMGVKNAYFPMLIPESLLTKEKEHVEGFSPEVAWVTMGGSTELPERLAIRPTSETIMYDSYKKWIRSWRDLPLRLNQWANIVRWEFKHPVPFLRTREFLWQEGHTVFATKKEAEDEVVEILDLYQKMHEELLGFPVLKGIKSDSEKFAGAVYTTSVETLFPNGKAIQVATSHLLGQKFSKAFDISFLDENGEKQYGWQNSWGFATRSIGIMLGIHGDDKGLVLPPRIAPIQVVIVPIIFDDTKDKVLARCKEIKKHFEDNNISVYLDNSDYKPGWKFNQWEMKGVPVRIEFGPKDLANEQCVVARRDNGKKEIIKLNTLTHKVKEVLEDIQNNLFYKAKEFLESSIIEVKDMDEFAKEIEKKKIVFAPFCDNAECEAIIKEKTGAKSLNSPLNQPEGQKLKCISCTAETNKKFYFGKSY